MISLEEIKKSYPENTRGFSRFILKEYLQYKILEIVFDSKFAHKLSFLGGTALRICYNSTRFSEDIDFDNFGLSINEFEIVADEINNKLTAEGYLVETRNIYKGAYHCYIKFPRLLFDNKLSGYVAEKILIQIDTAPHNFEYQPAIIKLDRFDIFTDIFATPKNILLSQKIFAASERVRAKGRDYFDIIFLLKDTIPDYKYLSVKMGISDSAHLKKYFRDHCRDIDFESLAKDVAPFLINPKEIERVSKFPELFEKMIS